MYIRVRKGSGNYREFRTVVSVDISKQRPATRITIPGGDEEEPMILSIEGVTSDVTFVVKTDSLTDVNFLLGLVSGGISGQSNSQVTVELVNEDGFTWRTFIGYVTSVKMSMKEGKLYTVTFSLMRGELIVG